MSFSINDDATVTRDPVNGSVTLANPASGHNVVLSPQAADALLSESSDDEKGDDVEPQPESSSAELDRD